MEEDRENIDLENSKDNRDEEDLTPKEKAAIEKLKQAEWSPKNAPKQLASYNDAHYSGKGDGANNTNEVRRFTGGQINQSRGQRSMTQKNVKRKNQTK